MCSVTVCHHVTRHPSSPSYKTVQIQQLIVLYAVPLDLTVTLGYVAVVSNYSDIHI